VLREKTLLKKTPKKVMAREPIKREPITFSRLTKEELKLEAALQREEVALGLRNANGSIPPSPAFPKIQSEERRLRLSAKTDRYGEQLANWLNASQRTPENHRVCKVIECFQATSASVTKAYWPTSVMVGGQVFSGRMPREVASGDREYEKQLSRLRRRVRSYTFFPSVHYPLERQWVGSWEPIGKRVQRSQFRLGEHDAVFWLYETATDGELDRLRQCDCGCGEWFFAHKLDRRFVRDHRQKEYRNSPEFKELRAEYMRNYRSPEKSELIEGHQRYRHRVTGRNSSRIRSNFGRSD